jgi:hypothetical protein
MTYGALDICQETCIMVYVELIKKAENYEIIKCW